MLIGGVAGAMYHHHEASNYWNRKGMYDHLSDFGVPHFRRRLHDGIGEIMENQDRQRFDAMGRNYAKNAAAGGGNDGRAFGRGRYLGSKTRGFAPTRSYTRSPTNAPPSRRRLGDTRSARCPSGVSLTACAPHPGTDQNLKKNARETPQSRQTGSAACPLGGTADPAPQH